MVEYFFLYNMVYFGLIMGVVADYWIMGASAVLWFIWSVFRIEGEHEIWYPLMGIPGIVVAVIGAIR
jgi:hypothetical protein